MATLGEPLDDVIAQGRRGAGEGNSFLGNGYVQAATTGAGVGAADAAGNDTDVGTGALNGAAAGVGGQAPALIEFTSDPARNAAGKPPDPKAWSIDLTRYAGPRRAEMACRAVG